MEKMIYTLWKPAGTDGDGFREQLLSLDAGLRASGVERWRLSVVDADVAPAQALRQSNSPTLPDAVISLWVDTAIRRAEQEALLQPLCAHFHGYLVTESEPIVNRDYQVARGQRTPGMNQVVFLQRPPRLAYEQWLQIWHGSHTQVAIETQSTFAYRQNVFVRPLTYAAPHYDAMIEENFPAEAMTSQHAFYAAGDDDALYQRNLQAMMESCQRFIDFDKVDVIPTSEYSFDAG